jgi:hypothetical protein
MISKLLLSIKLYILLWRTVALLEIDHEVSSYTTVVAK